MSRVMITKAVSVNTSALSGTLKPGDVIEANAAMLAAITAAGGTTRAAGAAMKDVLGEAVGVANGDGLAATAPNMTL